MSEGEDKRVPESGHHIQLNKSAYPLINCKQKCHTLDGLERLTMPSTVPVSESTFVYHLL